MGLLDIFAFSINAVLPLILIIVLGYFLKVKGLMSPEFVKGGNKVVFRVCLPVLLFCNVIEIEDFGQINVAAIAYVLGVIMVLLLIGLAVAATIKDKTQKGVMVQCIFRSNFALIGIPLSELIGGSNGVRVAALLSVFTIPLYNILGVIALSVFVGETKKGSIARQIKAIAKNPLIIGVFAGIVGIIIKGYIPAEFIERFNADFGFVQTTLKYISRTATPLALLVLGGQFEFTKIKGYRRQIITATLGRTVVAPAIGIGVAGLLQYMGVLSFAPEVFATFISLFGTPVAVSSSIMAEEMNNDGQLAAQLVVWTSILSMFTLFILIFCSRWAGLI